MHQPKQKDTSKQKKTSNQKETPKRACTEQLVEPQKRLKRLTTISTMSDVADIMIDTSQNSMVHQVSDSSMDDVVCLTDNISRHKPFADFDTISGRHPFTASVNSSIYYVSYIVFQCFICQLQSQSDRIYSVNGKRFKLKKDVLNRLFYYNKSPTSKNNQHIDKTFVDLLLLSAFDVSNLKQYKLDEDILDLIKGSSIK